MKNYIHILFIFCFTYVYSQNSTGINNTNPSIKAALDIQNATSVPQGILFPRLPVGDTSSLKTGITSAEKGLTFFDITNNVFKYWNGAKWLSYGGASASEESWGVYGNTLLAGDTGITAFKYIGTNNNYPFIIATNGIERVRVSRTGNVAIGMKPQGGVPLQLKSNGTGQVFRIEQSSNISPLFEFRQNPVGNSRLVMYDAAGIVSLDLNADPDINSFIDAGNFGIGTTTPALPLHVFGIEEAEPAASGNVATGNIRISIAGSPIAMDMGIADDAYSGAWIQSHYTNNQATNSNLLFNPNGGNVGVGTTSPLGKLHVNNGTVLYDGSTGDTPSSGGGTRFMWIPAKSSIRAGVALGDYWDDANIGISSASFNSNNISSGTNSTSIGQANEASGARSFAGGVGSIASGNGSTALGEYAHAAGRGEFSVGAYPLSTGAAGTFGVVFEVGNGTGTTSRNNALTVLYNGNVGIGCATPGFPLHVTGAIRSTVTISTIAAACSDIRYKKEIKPISKPLEIIQRIEGKTYLWRRGENKDWNFQGGMQYGFIAQEIEKIIPTLVYTDSSSDHYKSVDYAKLTPILVEGMKEQQKMIDSLRNFTQYQEMQLQQLKGSLDNKDYQLKEQKTLWLKHEEELDKIRQYLGTEVKK